MARDTTHSLQIKTDHDGISRRLSVLACKHAVRKTLQPALRSDFDKNAESITGRESYRLWSGLNRASQDRMWTLLAEQADVEQERIESVAVSLSETPKGSLQLDESLTPPDYQSQTTIHGQPGGYMLSRYSNDLAAGVLYEAGGNIYAMGQGIGKRDSKGQRLIAHIRERFPELKPKRILEMGCSAGGQSSDYPAAFPDAECHAIDLAPGMLRYAHARSEALGVALHIKQCDAASTGFPDDYFDLIISHNMFHEVAADHMPRILVECRRLLAPGGVCIHQDVPIQRDRFEGFDQFLSEWQVENNDEPFWNDFANADLPAMLEQAGFSESDVDAEYLQAIDGPIPWYVVTATRPAR